MCHHFRTPEQNQDKSCMDTALPDFQTLPSVRYTRQRTGYTRQTTLSKESHGNADFAECRITGTRQRICRVPWHSVNKPRGATPGPALCRVSNVRHSAKSPSRGAAMYGHVTILPSAGTRQIYKSLPSDSTLALGKVADLGRPLCRVFWLKHSAKWWIFLFLFLFSLFFHTNTTEIYMNAGHYRQL